MAEAETPTRAQVAAEVGTSTPRSQSRARGRSSRSTINSTHPEPPRPQDVSDAEFRAFNDELREKKRKAADTLLIGRFGRSGHQLHASPATAPTGYYMSPVVSPHSILFVPHLFLCLL